MSEPHTTAAQRTIGGARGLKIGLFGANCSSGRYMTLDDDRWTATWDENLRMARAADEAGLDFLLPIARWKGYGGETDFAGTSFETLTWATALLAATKRITVFGTVHVPLFHPLLAAKQMVTADHVGAGRFALNVVAGWNEDEFAMFGITGGDHAARYARAAEWIDVVRRAWTEDDFSYSGRFYTLRNVRLKPKPYGGTLPVIMNAGRSTQGEAFALHHGDMLFTSAGYDADPRSLEPLRAKVADLRARARALGRSISVFASGTVLCRPTRREAIAYHHHLSVERADWGAVDGMMQLGDLAGRIPPERYAEARARYAATMGGFLCIGSPDDIAASLATIHSLGYDGVALTGRHYADELHWFPEEILPRLEARDLSSR